MHSDKLRRPYEPLMSEVFSTPRRPPLLVLSGPPGMDLDSAIEEILAHCNSAYPNQIRIVNLSFSDPRPQFPLPDHLLVRGASRPTPATVLLVRDGHKVHAESLATLEKLVRQLRGTTSTCVCVVALPLPPHTRAMFAAAFDRLSRDGLVRHVTLRPLSPRQLGTFIAGKIEAVLEPAALAGLWEATRGWPAAAGAVIETFHECGMIRMVDRRAYLTRGFGQRWPNTEPPVRWIRRMGTDIWRAAKAAAVLTPLGEAMPWLIAEAMEISPAEAAHLLARLELAGVLKYRQAQRAWRFRLPLVASCLEELLGPYEQRRLAQVAVTALWNGSARCADAHYLPDQLVRAGAMVDRERARNELLTHAGRVAVCSSTRAIPWLRAAADLTTDPAERVGILLTHTKTCLVRGAAVLALESSDTVLKSYAREIPAGQLLDVLFVHLNAVHRAGETCTLEKIVRDGWWPWPGTSLEQTVTRAYALSLLGRWAEARDLMDAARGDQDLSPAGHHAEVISAVAELWLGVTAGFDRLISALSGRLQNGESPFQEVNQHAGTLLVLAERDRAEELIGGIDGAPVQLDLPGRSLVAVYHGRIDEALDLAHKSIATSAPHGCDHVQTAMYQIAAVLQLFRGKLARARELIMTARTRQPTLPHLLAIPEARYELVFGEIARAEVILESALDRASEEGVLARTEGLWIMLADIALHHGHGDRLPGYLREVDRVADRMGTELAEIDRLTLRALVESDPASARAALELTTRRQQPLERVVVVHRLVRYGIADPALLAETYALLGEMNALLSRASTRTLMRLHGVAIPGRQEAVAENERLLAVLVAEGLSNKQIANALDSSEKSVEGRLSRLFSRTSYQSRVELATAMLTGQFH